MSGPLSLTTRALVATSDLLGIVTDIERSQQMEGDNGTLERACLINKLALLGFTVSESVVLLAKPDSAETLSTMKAIELLPRAFNIPISMMYTDFDESVRPMSTTRKIERFVAPVADFLRVITEGAYYEASKYLEMPPEEVAKAKIPIRDGDRECPRIIGCRPVDLEECREVAERAKNEAETLALLRGLTEVGIVSDGVEAGQRLYENIAGFMRKLTRRNHGINIVEQDTRRNHGINIVEQDFIIPMLHRDAVFRRYICSITHAPIRHPVGDPNGTTLYERSAILRWLSLSQTSPTTRNPLTPLQLINKPAIQALIDARLQEHQNNLERYLLEEEDVLDVLEANLEAPVPCALAHPVIDEEAGLSLNEEV